MTETIKHEKGRGSSIAAENLHEVLTSGKNSAQTGQSAYETPVAFARMCAIPLPDQREIIVDLQGGHGQFCIGASNDTTDAFLVNDIENVRTVKYEGRASTVRVCADAFKFYDLLKEIDADFDLMVLNPPFSLHVYRSSVSRLGATDLDRVREAFAGYDPMAGKDCVDSTPLTLMIALDLMSMRGEGCMLANNRTLERLIFREDAPHRALTTHIWSRIVLTGLNPMTGISDNAWEKDQEIEIACIYFAKDHYDGPQAVHRVRTLPEFEAAAKDLKARNYRLRAGMRMSYGYGTKGQVENWKAAKDEWNVRTGQGKATSFNLWLNPDGTIGTYLSVFSQKSPKIPKSDAEQLFGLTGQRPMGLVLQRSQRQCLLRAVNGGIWRVEPRLQKAVEEAVREYNAVRAPLWPLTPIQQIGFIDELDTIDCKADLSCDQQPETDGEPKRKKAVKPPVKVLAFRAGKSYPIRTATVATVRSAVKPGMDGQDHDLSLAGHELCIWIKGEDGREYSFLDRRLERAGAKFTAEVVQKHEWGEYTTKTDVGADFGLEDVERAFRIPHVPDIAAVWPDKYQANLKFLDELEARMLNGYKFKSSQRRDIARGAVPDGFILAASQGYGKTMCAIALALMKVGWRKELPGFVPMKPVLIIMPANLHEQSNDEYESVYGFRATELDCQSTFYKLSPLKPGFYLSSFTQIATNKIKSMPEIPAWNIDGNSPEVAEAMLAYGVTVEDAQRHVVVIQKPDGKGEVLEDATLVMKAMDLCRQRKQALSEGIGEEHHGVKCVYSPSLADLVRHAFECVLVDEAVRIQAEDSLIGVGVRSLEPKFRCVLTGTPIKNRLPSIFYLCWWAAGGKQEAHARFPYSAEQGEQDKFINEFMVFSRDLTKERAEAAARGDRYYNPNRSRRKGQASAEICNIHRLWKFLGPLVLRRRLEDMGEEIQPMLRQPIRVPMGTMQAQVYKYHLTADYKDKNGQAAIGAKLQALRNAAAAPHSELLHFVDNQEPAEFSDEDDYSKDKEETVRAITPAKEQDNAPPYRSKFEYIPKVAAALTVIHEVLERREQVVVFSAFHEPLDTLARRLREASVPFDLLDGRMNPKRRGQLANEFKKGLAGGGKPVLLAGNKACAEGYSWHLCNNAILVAYDWSFDLFDQAIKRIQRLNSVKPVNIYPIICDGTIDCRLESFIHEKKDSVELALDGKLLTENIEEFSLAKLLQVAFSEFNDMKTMKESDVEAGWPALRAQLANAAMALMSKNATIEEAKKDSKTIVLEAVRAPAQKVWRLPGMFSFGK